MRRCLGVYYLAKRIVQMGGSFAVQLPCDMAVDSFENDTGFSGQAPELSFSVGSPEELSAYGNGLVPVVGIPGRILWGGICSLTLAYCTECTPLRSGKQRSWAFLTAEAQALLLHLREPLARHAPHLQPPADSSLDSFALAIGAPAKSTRS